MNEGYAVEPYSIWLTFAIFGLGLTYGMTFGMYLERARIKHNR